MGFGVNTFYTHIPFTDSISSLYTVYYIFLQILKALQTVVSTFADHTLISVQSLAQVVYLYYFSRLWWCIIKAIPKQIRNSINICLYIHIYMIYIGTGFTPVYEIKPIHLLTCVVYGHYNHRGKTHVPCILDYITLSNRWNL